ncbi:neuropilin-1-like [Amphiura filiformis]|uniref:neuropilin-1-like n=1 Tax=Amphiura filiformis TaxID=82378 RepID=UPI003B20DDAB
MIALNDNECTLSTDNCDANATCTNTVGSFTCACNVGYNGDGVTCTDDNECILLTDNCDANAACTNIPVGSFTCECNAGYRGDGVTCTVCMDYLGMENGTIPDGNIQASSEYKSIYSASKGRLNGELSSWHAAPFQTGPIWIQADIGILTYVSGVITQGDGYINKAGADYVTSFKVSTFLITGANEVFVEDKNEKAIIFLGNVDQHAEVTTIFPEPVFARIVRIICLTKFRDYCALRFEILGCKNDYIDT